MFKISFIQPQIGRQQEQQQGQQQQEEAHQKDVNIRWNTINDPKRKWARKVSTTASSGAVDNGRASAKASTSRIIDVKLSSAEPHADPSPEALLHQRSIQKIPKKAGRRLQLKYGEGHVQPAEDIPEPSQSQKLRQRRTQHPLAS